MNAPITKFVWLTTSRKPSECSIAETNVGRRSSAAGVVGYCCTQLHLHGYFSANAIPVRDIPIVTQIIFTNPSPSHSHPATHKAFYIGSGSCSRPAVLAANIPVLNSNVDFCSPLAFDGQIHSRNTRNAGWIHFEVVTNRESYFRTALLQSKSVAIFFKGMLFLCRHVLNPVAKLARMSQWNFGFWGTTRNYTTSSS